MFVSSDFLYFCHCERSEAIQSSLRPYGLLRGVYHRARIRATRWLAMTVSDFVTEYQAVSFASAESNAAAALGKSLNASPLSADCFCTSVAVGRISPTAFAPPHKPRR